MVAPLSAQLGSGVRAVRVHRGPASVQATKVLGAHAFTIGRDIYLGAGVANEGWSSGRLLPTLLHELAHTNQQPVNPTTVGPPLQFDRAPYEREAESVAWSLIWGHRSSEYGRVATAVGPGPLKPVCRMRPRLSLHRPAPQLIELSYDDGPDTTGNTRKVLDYLNAAGARATFYLVGQRVIEGDNWKLVFDIAASGHWLGNHAFDWNSSTDNHIFLNGPPVERARKILITELAIRDALIKGKSNAQQQGAWASVPPAHRAYIDDVIAKGTGRFRTPGFRSKWWREDGRKTQAAISITNQTLHTAGLRTFDVSDSVDIDPEDWRAGRTQQDVERETISELDDEDDSILLHSRISASAEATPAILAAINGRGWTYTAPSRGDPGVVAPRPPFADLRTVSSPPTRGELLQARAFMLNHLDVGPVLMGTTAMGIFKLAYLAGSGEVADFMQWLQTTPGPEGHGYLTNFLYEWDEFRLFYEFIKFWRSGQPFPTGPGVTY
jgi:peptidoglycan/xylan/chitin deacetylase (PgdA/CDA1 family)